MATIDTTKIDLYTVNQDYSGARNLENTQELVQFQSQSLHRIWFNEQVENYSAHWHPAIEIIVPVENYYDAVINGTPYHILPGEILIIPPGDLHELMAPDYGQRFIFIMDISSISKMSGYSGINSILSTPPHLSKESHPGIFDEIYQLLVQIRNIYFNSDEYGELKIHALLTTLLVRLAEYHINTTDIFPNVRIYKQKEYIQKFNTVLDYINTHYAEDIILEDIAELAGFSKFHFSRLFKQYTDMTFCDYLNFRRIKAAEELLSGPDLSITELALQSGFPSISTFNRLFKQKHGCTPTEYRAKHNRYNPVRSDR